MSMLKTTISLFLITLFSGFAQAQEPVRGETVGNRSRPEVDPIGRRAGGFLLYSSVTAGLLYDDNVFTEPAEEKSDTVGVLIPAVSLESQWGLHALNLGANYELGRYSDFGDEDFDDYHIHSNGRYDFERGSSLSGRLNLGREHEDRSSPDDVRGETPTEFMDQSLSMTYTKGFNRLSLKFIGALRQLDYEDVQSPSGEINNDDRDRDDQRASIRLGYELSPNLDFFARYTANDRSYDQQIDDNGFERDSSGYKAVAGAAVDFTGVTFGEFFIGGLSQDYDDSRLPTIDGTTFGAEITWNPSGLTTVIVSVSRDVRETINPNASGYLETKYQIGVDHELFRNAILQGDVSTRNDDWKGVDREEDTFKFSFGVKYLATRNYHIFAGYDFEDRDSKTTSDREFKRQTLGLKVQAHF